MSKGRIQRVDITTELPRIGRVKTGYKTKDGSPRSSDYFIPTGAYAEYFSKVYGKEPKKIEIMFLSDDFDKVCNEQFELRDNAGKLIAYGDGVEFKMWWKDKYLDYNIMEHPDLHEKIKQSYPNAGEWKEVLELNFIIPKIRGVVGQWQYRTHAKESSIPTIRNAFDTMLNERGFVKGIIFDLVVEMHVSNKPDSKSRYPVVRLVPNMSPENIEMVRSNLLGQDVSGLLPESKKQIESKNQSE